MVRLLASYFPWCFLPEKKGPRLFGHGHCLLFSVVTYSIDPIAESVMSAVQQLLVYAVMFSMGLIYFFLHFPSTSYLTPMGRTIRALLSLITSAAAR